MRKELLNLLRVNCRLKNEELAAMLAVSTQDVEREIAALEEQNIIMGYSAVINEEKFDKNAVTAHIELKVSPQMENGYAAVAKKVGQFRQVESVQLMSGAYDLAVTVKGDNLREVALFVSERLAAMDGVLSTSTHFILERFKEKGVLFSSDDDDERSLTSP
ncbi:MAG: Lrp/AsnC family transcriptional regulator [Oscillospiraceae bacterium]|nr:Lrp/AsnC family transcriptional regulator [Oscillospiraceae bacterium]